MANVRTATVAFLVALGAAGSLIYTARTYRLSKTSQLAQRFQAACQQLGDERAAAVRLAGAYALGHLADEWPEQRQTCIDVLCAYLRMPYRPGVVQGEREVRLGVLRTIREHLLDGPKGQNSWNGARFDMNGATFDQGDLSQVILSGCHFSFNEAEFIGWFSFKEADFANARVTFNATTFQPGSVVEFDDAQFSRCQIGMIGARMLGGVVTFQRAAFLARTKVAFMHMELGGGVLSFRSARFLDSQVGFMGANLISGALSLRDIFSAKATIDLRGARYAGARVLLPSPSSLESPLLVDWTLPPPGVDVAQRFRSGHQHKQDND